MTTQKTLAYETAQNGALKTLQEIAGVNKNDLHLKDENGWQPLHEAVRSGHVDIVDFLVKNGGDVNKSTNQDGTGGSPLWWAIKPHDAGHEMIRFLRILGALNIGPEL